MTSSISLITYNGGLFKDHWSLFIPTIGEDIGYRLHATGDLRTGFEFELRERYDLENTNRRHTRTFLSEIADVDRVVQIARQTPTPGPSLRSTSYDGPKVRLSQQRNCQDWVIDVLEALESEGLVRAGTRNQVKTQS
ncbi:hypothetical protein TWF192_008649 [Orbilia oligospora]|uniref:Uncharacterized protein n=1 Tax=Orbilia oligospora TaxID=2813651 RepID=A0A6G1M1M7_ORBOL|nr:hypothetical protein TWF679_008148 [Orbilia oligospora]KAF3232383.1 hypothetical protein TWF191_000155 [Orbilia oligospora]KAF3242393.1 hypothetical protein TWF192_008649 [Orbilia oligospora]